MTDAFFLLADFLLLTAFFLEAFLAAGFFLLGFFLLTDFFLLAGFRAGFFLLAFFFVVAFFRGGAFFFLAVFLADAFDRAAFLLDEAFLRLAAAFFRDLLGAFLAGISYSCRIDKRRELYIAGDHMEAKSTGFSDNRWRALPDGQPGRARQRTGRSKGVIYEGKKAWTGQTVRTSRQSFYLSGSFTLPRFMDPWPTGSQCA